MRDWPRPSRSSFTRTSVSLVLRWTCATRVEVCARVSLDFFISHHLVGTESVPGAVATGYRPNLWILRSTRSLPLPVLTSSKAVSPDSSGLPPHSKYFPQCLKQQIVFLRRTHAEAKVFTQ